MPIPRFGGIRRVLYKLAGTGAFPTFGGAAVDPVFDCGEVKEDSGFETQSYAEDNKNTRGEGVFAGDMDVYTVNVFTQTRHSDLRTRFINGARLDVRFEFLDGSTTEDVMDVMVQVGRIQARLKPGENSFFSLKIPKYVTA